MAELISDAGGAVAVFTGTNIDDILVLTALFVMARTTGRPAAAGIVTGQYLGIAALVSVSAVVAAGLLAVPEPWTGLLGLLPIALGVRALVGRDGETATGVVTSTLGVAGVTIANGADNIAVYVPVFHALDVVQALVYLVVFAVLVALWCLAAARLGGHPGVVAVVERTGSWLVPAVFIGIGVVILVSSGVPGRII